MEHKDELKEDDIKNCSCYYFVDIMRVRDIDPSDTLLDEKSYENILIYNISYKTFMGAKPLHIRFDKIDGFIITYGGIRYLEIFGYWLYDEVYNRTRYLLSKKKWYCR